MGRLVRYSGRARTWELVNTGGFHSVLMQVYDSHWGGEK
jgi:hypothetical protein